jgi:hypothetical protein
MSAAAILTIIAVCIWLIGTIAGNVFGLLMAEEVDRRKPDLNLYSCFSRFNRRLDRGFEMFRLYRRLCPEGKLYIYELACFAVAAVGFISFLLLVVINYTAFR